MQTNGRTVLGLGLIVGALTMAAGCVGPSENQGTGGDGEMATVAQAVETDCAQLTNPAESQKRAVRAFRYILGTNGVGECADFKVKADVVRNAIKDGTLNVYLPGYGQLGTVCGVRTKRTTTRQSALTSTPNPGALWQAINDLGTMGGVSDTCFGNGTSTFLMLSTGSTAEAGGYRNWAEWDPELATLIGNLSGGSASAEWSDHSLVTGYRFGANLGSICGGAITGSPCSSTPKVAGEELLGLVVKKGSLCFCQ